MRKDIEVYRIIKLKRSENRTLWVEKLKFCLIFSQLWFYISELKKKSLSFALSNLLKKNDIQRAMIKSEQIVYDAKLKQYKKNHKKWVTNHNKICATMHISFEQKSRSHVKNMKNDTEIFQKFKSLYDTIDFVIIDLTLQKICKKSLIDFKNVDVWAKHLRKWKNEIKEIDEIVFFWMMSNLFRMNLSKNLNSYMFNLVYEIKLREAILIIDDMIKTLIDQNKRDNHIDDIRNSARTIKNVRNKSTKFSKNNESDKNKDNDKKNRDIDSCECCESSIHDKLHCFYCNKNKRFADWKLYEFKIHLTMNWSNKKNFVSINKIDKIKKNDNIKRVKFDSIVSIFKSNFSI